MRVGVVGTGTGVGKTHVACALLLELRRRGQAPRGLKPVESGCGGAGQVGDAERLAEAAGHEVVLGPYRFEEAVSPHLAARRTGVRIELGVVVDWVGAAGGASTVVEGAGGLLSPLSERLDNLGLMSGLGVDSLVVVAPDRLGVLHDVAAVGLALRVRWGGRWVVVLSAPERADGSTGTNGRELVELGLVDGEVVELHRGALQDPASRAAACRLAEVLVGPGVSRET
ncbi:MAG: dethiobiotin synthase [Armatimonadetes bacterium]|nr:dethiobiotin synthase [Armatimonadota bacterium]